MNQELRIMYLGFKSHYSWFIIPNSPMDIPDFLQPEIDRLDQQIAENQALLTDPSMADLAREEIAKLEQTKTDLLASQETTSNLNDDSTGNEKRETRNVNVALLEFRPAAGGDEAKIWASDLMRMYVRYANSQGWQITQIDDDVIKIKGPGAYLIFQYESGVHRVQRVPETEAQGRIHTSTATVAVLPEIKPSEVNIKPEDIDFVPFKRSSGAGGQNVNKVSTAVRITHIATGITVEASHERSQLANRDFAMQLLAAKLWELEEEKRLEQLSDARSSIGRGMRSEKIRTYNYPQNRVTDHRINVSWQELDTIIEGKLDKILNALTAPETTIQAI